MNVKANVFLAISLDSVVHAVLIWSMINVHCTRIPHSKANYISFFNVEDTYFLSVTYVNVQNKGFSIKLLKLRFMLCKLKSSLQPLHGYVTTMTWLTGMEYLCHKWARICSICRKHFSVLSSLITYHRVCNQINITGVTNDPGADYHSGAPEFTPGF